MKTNNIKALLQQRKNTNEDALKLSIGYENMADKEGQPNQGEENYREALRLEIQQCEYLIQKYDEKYPQDNPESEAV